jgi:predicted carbohydrate-binding protein with CBM5 and CBM33 domain
MRSTQLLIAAIPFVSAHGIIENPLPRLAGLAMKAACGEQVYNNQKSDSGGNIEGILQVAKSQKDYDPTKCNIQLCKGYQFADNSANIQNYAPGQTIPIKVAIKAPHTGSANVSIIDTKSGQAIGQPLITFADYASNAHTIPANNTQFSITMPQDMGGKCGQAGDCVIQWFWTAPEAKQTYESCIDFQTGGAAAPKKMKRQAASPVMESMTNGPKSTLGISAVSMSMTPSLSASVPESKMTGSASKSAKGSSASDASASGEATASKSKSAAGSASGTTCE